MKTLAKAFVLAAALAFTLTGVANATPPQVPDNYPAPQNYSPKYDQKYETPKAEYVYRGGCKYKKVIEYVTDVRYEKREEAYTKYVTEYDHCGKPYSVKKVCYREIEVPVKYTRAVCKYIKVCH